MDLTRIAAGLVRDVSVLTFRPPVSHVYNPLEYAGAAFAKYVSYYGRGRREVIMLGMNPGPWGMAQTGVPFGEVAAVREWLGIVAPVGRPTIEHPRRKVQGFDCPRSEISGARLWGWARATFGTPAVFFRRFFVANYCPLMFLEATGRNRTPDKLPPDELRPLLEACDLALRRVVEYFRPQYVVGVGRFAEQRIRAALADVDVAVGAVLHPSPASPQANKGWAHMASRQLAVLGVSIP